MTSKVVSRIVCIGTYNFPGESFIYINGLGLLEEDKILFDSAKNNAAEISKKIDNRRVVLFFNPTSFINIPDLDKFKKALVQLICQEAERCLKEATNPRIVILAHSHGTVLLRDAMSDPTITKLYSQHIELAGFGGARLLPKSAGRKVKNYINEKDPIPHIAMTEQFSDKLGEFEQKLKSVYLGDETHLVQTFTLRLKIAEFEYILVKKWGLGPLESKSIIRNGILLISVIYKHIIEQKNGPTELDVNEVEGMRKKYHVKLLDPSPQFPNSPPIQQHLMSHYLDAIGKFING